MTLASPQEPRPSRSSGVGTLALDRDADCLPVRAVLGGSSCRWPRSGEPTPTRGSTGRDRAPWDIVDEWGAESFPASDPPANW
jgi:hypothetical protein